MDTTLNATGTLLYSLLGSPLPTLHSYTITILDPHQDPDDPATCVVHADGPGAAISNAISTYFSAFYGSSVNPEVTPLQDAVTIIHNGLPVAFFAGDPEPIRLQRVGDPIPIT